MKENITTFYILVLCRILLELLLRLFIPYNRGDYWSVLFQNIFCFSRKSYHDNGKRSLLACVPFCKIYGFHNLHPLLRVFLLKYLEKISKVMLKRTHILIFFNIFEIYLCFGQYFSVFIFSNFKLFLLFKFVMFMGFTFFDLLKNVVCLARVIIYLNLCSPNVL